MHVHLPKPLHGWREFIGEVGIIVVGVLIALGAEQVVENFHWRHEVEAGREAVRENLVGSVRQSFEREAMSRCLAQRLQYVATILDQASNSGRLPPAGPIGNPAKRIWQLQSWDSMVASQVATHFPKQEMIALGDLDAYLQSVNALNADEFNQWTILWTMVGPGRRLAIGEESQLRQALARAHYDAKLMRIAANQIPGNIRESHLLSDEELAKVAKDEKTEMRKYFPIAPLCQPIGAAPAHYGGSPLMMDLMAPYPSGT